MDKNNLKIRFVVFFACLFMLFLWVICLSISSNSFLFKLKNVLSFFTILSFILMIILTIIALINWIIKRSPWYEFVIYITILISIVFIAFIQFVVHWQQGTGAYHWRTHTANYADSVVIGKWINTTDSSIKLIFPNKNFCETYRSNKLIRTDSVIISNNISICNVGLSTKNLEDYNLYIRFEQKTGKIDTLSHSCYAILHINDTNFDFTTGDGSIISYQKQQ